MTIQPEAFITLPINGEPQITNNNIAIGQDWCKYEMLNVMLSRNAKVKEIGNFFGPKKPIGFELDELKSTLNNFLGSFLGEEGGLEGGW